MIMAITSFYFLCFFAITLGIYYVIPKKLQWVFLLLVSGIYFVTSGNYLLILYPYTASYVTFFGAIRIKIMEEQKRKKAVLSFHIVFLLIFLLILKYLNFGIYSHNALIDIFHLKIAYWERFRFLIPLGISFYTLSLIGYLCDVYWELCEPEKNFFRFALFGMYFPVMISGPIISYKDLKEQLFEKHEFQYKQVTFGMQRILWGFFKKLVISERLSILVSTVYNDYTDYPGIFIWIATIGFAFQLYTDFSGCMDIVIGISESFGIILPENFNTPFFSRTMQEFWRKWHITLGAWLKNYIFYPLLRTKFFGELPKKLKPKFGKKVAKQMTTFSAMFILWFAIGLWHGGAWKYIIGSGLLHWFYIVMGETLEPVWKKFRAFFHINVDGKGFIIFQRCRTFCLASSGFLFFNSGGLRKALAMYVSMFTTTNFEVLWNGSLLNLGLNYKDIVILAISLLILFVISCMQQKCVIRERLSKCPIVLRWIILYALLYYVILLGNYGPGYSASEFIYAGF